MLQLLSQSVTIGFMGFPLVAGWDFFFAQKNIILSRVLRLLLVGGAFHQYAHSHGQCGRDD